MFIFCGVGTAACTPGATVDLVHRLEVHSSGKGAKYTRSHLPVELAYQEQTEDWPAALRREAAIKRMSRAQKLALIAEYANADPRKERP